jgi:hypothetical protein
VATPVGLVEVREGGKSPAGPRLGGSEEVVVGKSVMATGIVISAVLWAAALMRFSVRFSQYSRAAETAVLVSQYSERSSSTSSRVGCWFGSLP